MEKDETLHSAKRASAKLGININTLYRYLKTGLIKGSYYARKWHISEAQIQAFIVQQQMANRK